MEKRYRYLRNKRFYNIFKLIKDRRLKEKFFTFTKSLIVSAIMLSPILCLLQHPVKYPLYTFLVAITLLLSVRCWKYNLNIRLQSDILYELPIYMGITSSLSLLILNFLNIRGFVNLLCALYTVSFMPGLVVIRIIKLHRSFLETLILSFLLSVAVTGLFVTPLVYVSEDLRAFIIAFEYLFFSIIPLIIEKFNKKHSKQLKTYEFHGDIINLALIITIILLFSLILGTLYPAITYAPADDIVAHWRSARLISKSPETYASPYPWFHIFESTIYILSKPSMAYFMSTLSFLCILLVLGFYVLANAYLKDIDPDLPILSTVIWFFFSGFGWLHYIQELCSTEIANRKMLLSIVINRSYWDTLFGQGPWLWLFFRPLTLGFLLLFTLLFLLKLQNLKSCYFIFITSILIIALGMIHFPELLVFIAVLLLALVFTPQLNIRLKETFISTSLGLAGISIIKYILHLQKVTVNIPYNIPLLLIPASLLGWCLTSRSWNGIKIPMGQNVIKWMCRIILITFLAGLFSRLSSPEDFSIKLVGSWVIPSSVFMVPWNLYPILLGISGLIFIIFLQDISNVIKKNRSLILFILLGLVAIIMGRTLSFFNTFFDIIFYIERRFIPILFTSISLLVSIPLLKITNNLLNSKRIISPTLLLGFIIVIGTASTCLSVEYWNTTIYSEGTRVAEEDWGGINYLYSVFEENSNSRIFTITDRSRWELNFAAPGLIVNTLARPLWTARYPELPLWILQGAYPKYVSSYIYLHNRDKLKLQQEFSDTFMNLATSSILPEIYQDSVATIMYVPEGSFPSHDSNIALITPSSYNKETAWTYSLINTLLSFGGYEYTTLYELDSRIKNKEIILVPLDDYKIVKNLLEKVKGRSDLKLIIFNTGGYGYFTDYFIKGETLLSVISPENLTVSINTLHPVDGTLTFLLRNNKYRVNYKSLVTDNHTSFWNATPYGKGNIALAILTNDFNFKTEGANGLRLEVGKGKYAQWQITHIYETPQDWSMYDFFMFDWYGHGDNKRYIVEFYAPDHTNYFWHEFIDDWHGWKRVLIPLKMPEGKYKIFGTRINKVKKGAPSWNEIKTINFRLSATNPNQEGTWFIDNVGLDMGRWITIKAIINTENITQIKLHSLNDIKTTWVNVRLGQQISLDAKQVYFMDSTQAYQLYGSQPIFTVSLNRLDDSTEIIISAKMPPLVSNYSKMDQYQLAFNIKFPVKKSEITKLSNVQGDIELPLPSVISVPFASFTKNVQIVGWYVGEKSKIPLAARKNIDGVEVIYVNIYPLVQALKDDKKNLSRTLSNILEVIGIILPKKTDYSPEELLNLLVFREASFQGNITIESESIIFNSKQNQNFTQILLYLKEEPTHIRNIESMDIDGIENVKIISEKVKIDKGIGFYSSILLKNASITLKGTNPTLTIQFINGSIQRIQRESEIKMIVPDSTNFLARLIQVKLNGNVTFKEAYGLQTVFSKLRASGQNVNISGYMKMDLILNDYYSIARNLTVKGRVNLTPPILQWDEIGSIKKSIIWFMVAAFIVLVSSMLKEERHNMSE